ncbi:MAG: Ser-Thr-rich GPI-anchored membrane family protein [Acidobacteriota bacterium]
MYYWKTNKFFRIAISILLCLTLMQPTAWAETSEQPVSNPPAVSDIPQESLTPPPTETAPDNSQTPSSSGGETINNNVYGADNTSKNEEPLPAPVVEPDKTTTSEVYDQPQEAPVVHPLGAMPTAPSVLQMHMRASISGLVMASAPPPPSIDWSSNMPPVGDQGQQGSCTAWAVGYAQKTFLERKEHNWSTTTTNHQFSPAYLYNQINGGNDYGAYIGDAFNVVSQQGCDTLDDMPYSQFDYRTQPTAAQRQRAAMFKNSGWSTLGIVWGNADLNTIKNALVRGPIVAGTSVFWGTGWDYRGDIAKADGTPYGLAGYHAICLVGYDDSYPTRDGVGAFKFINSWGTGWGHAGYGWISYPFAQANFFEADAADDMLNDSYSASGTVTSSGTGLADVTMTATVVSGTAMVPAAVVTNATGNWSVTGLSMDATYKITPSKAGYVFNPGSIDFNFDTIRQTSLLFQASTGGPGIAITSPKTNTTWPSGTNQNITWTCAGSPGPLKIELLHSNSVVILSGSTTAEAQQLVWNIPTSQTAANDYQIRLTSTTNPAVTATSDPFSIVTGTFSVSGKVTLNSIGLAGVNLAAVVVSGSAATPVPVVTDTSGNWALTSLPVDSSFRITPSKAGFVFSPASIDFNYNNSQSTNFTFTALNATPTITITAPKSNPSWTTGSTHGITWTFTGSPGPVRIELQKAGISIGVINSVPVENVFCNWIIPTTLAAGSDYTIKIISNSNPAVNTTSETFTIIPATTVNVIEPAINTQAAAGSNLIIKWNYTGNPGSFKIDLLKGTCVVTSVYANAPAADKQYVWQIPASVAAGTDYKIQLTSSLDAACLGLSEIFTITDPPNVTIVTPTAGELWVQGTSHKLVWSYKGNPGPLKIELLKAGTTVSTLVDNTPVENKEFIWPIPAEQAAGTDYQIKMSSIAQPSCTVNSGSFTIASPTAISFIGLTNETWQVGTSHVIKWTYTGTPDPFKLDLLSNGTVFTTIYSKVSVGTGGTGSYTWLIPTSIPVGTYQLKLSAASANGIGSAVSGNIFITNAIITSPVTGTTWKMGTTQVIRWKYTGPTTNLKLDLYKGSISAHTIALSVPSSAGYFNWPITTALRPGNDYFIQLSNPATHVILYNTGLISLQMTLGTVTINKPTASFATAAGSKINIGWTYSGAPGYLKVELLKGVSPVAILSSGIAATNQQFNWTIPSNQPAGADYKVRLTGTADPDTTATSDNFTICTPTSITFTTPAVGTVWQPGTAQTLNWNYTAAPDKFMIELLRGTTVVSTIPDIAADGTGKGSYQWNIPPDLYNGTYQLRLSASGVNGMGSGTSSSFLISQVMLNSPANGDVWGIGTFQNVNWNYTGIDIKFNIDLMKSNVYIRNIASNVYASQLSYKWFVPATQAAGTDYQIRVRCSFNGSVAYSGPIFTFAQNPATAALTSPVAGTVYSVNTSLPIKWSFTGNPGTFQVELLKSGSQAAMIATSQAIGSNGVGAMYWTLPATLRPGNDYQVRLTSTLDPNCIALSENFGIKNPASVRFMSPLSGTTWLPGSTHTINWTYKGYPEVFKLDLYKSGVVTPTIIDANVSASTAGNGTYTWTLPMDLPAGYYALKLTSTFPGGECSASSATITVSKVIITSPLAGNIWAKGSVQTITWGFGGTPINLRIYLMKGSATVSTLTTSVAGTQGSFSYTPPATLIAGTDYRIRITDDKGVTLAYTAYFTVQ